MLRKRKLCQHLFDLAGQETSGTETAIHSVIFAKSANLPMQTKFLVST